MSASQANRVFAGVIIAIVAAGVIGQVVSYGAAQGHAVRVEQHEVRIGNAEEDVRTIARDIADIKATGEVNKKMLEQLSRRLERFEGDKR